MRHPRGMLHPHFVVAVLNDLFGIQARGGCFCAGPYLQRLNEIDEASRRRDAGRGPARSARASKLGWFRLNFNYFVSEAVVDYIIDAVNLVADEGHEARSPSTASTRSRACGTTATPTAAPAGQPVRHLLRSGAMEFRSRHDFAPEGALAGQLDDARRLVASLPAELARTGAIEDPVLPDSYERMRWFPMPVEAQREFAAP